MPKVSVRMFASVREAAGISGCEIAASNLGELIDSMRLKFGAGLARILAEREADPDRLVILVNGRNIGRTPAGTVRLADGDEVAIFPPVSGG